MNEFIIARNPEAKSALPFLLGIPLERERLWLKAKESWPRSVRVYCHPLGYVPTLERLEILERLEVRFCQRNGPAIDLVLARRTNRRAQFVFAHRGDRPLIFWQTARSARAARPGVRIPARPAPVASTLYVDTRERYGYTFDSHHSHVERRKLAVGDYAAMIGDAVLAVVERKRLEDFASSLVDGSLNYAMAELTSLPAAAVAVEGTYAQVLRHRYTSSGFLPTLIGRVQMRYPHIPILFLESRKLAEEWTYQYLLAAYGNAAALPLDVGLCNTPPTPGVDR